MPHMPASLRGVKPEIIKQVFLNDTQAHAQEGFTWRIFG
jgi:hypothetical protein